MEYRQEESILGRRLSTAGSFAEEDSNEEEEEEQSPQPMLPTSSQLKRAHQAKEEEPEQKGANNNNRNDLEFAEASLSLPSRNLLDRLLHGFDVSSAHSDPSTSAGTTSAPAPPTIEKPSEFSFSSDLVAPKGTPPPSMTNEVRSFHFKSSSSSSSNNNKRSFPSSSLLPAAAGSAPYAVDIQVTPSAAVAQGGTTSHEQQQYSFNPIPIASNNVHVVPAVALSDALYDFQSDIMQLLGQQQQQQSLVDMFSVPLPSDRLSATGIVALPSTSSATNRNNVLSEDEQGPAPAAKKARTTTVTSSSSSSSSSFLQNLGKTQAQQQQECWMGRYQELIEFRNTFGNCNVPYLYADNKPLGKNVLLCSVSKLMV
jgi:hypothetical protein